MTNAPGLAPIEILTNGRRSHTGRLTMAERRVRLQRLVQRAPEAIVKVSGGGQTAQHIRAHMDYITRHGKLPGLTDDGEVIQGREAVKELVDAWDLDIVRTGPRIKRQAFNIVLSMPRNTDAQGLKTAAERFARDTFYGRHPYLTVLHTDTAHPHVHLVVKAEGYDGQRLYIRKADLEQWRERFAEKLREQGIEANATPRELRGQTRKAKKQPVHHAERRGASHVTRAKAEEAGRELRTGAAPDRPWEEKITARRKTLVGALLATAQELQQAGDRSMAQSLVQFARDLPPLETERHVIKQRLVASLEPSRQAQRRQTAPREPTPPRDHEQDRER